MRWSTTPDLLAGMWLLLAEQLGAIPRRLVWDNEAGIGRRNKLAEGVTGFVGTLGTRIVQLKPFDPESKGIVERANQYLETSFLPGRTFTSPADFNEQLADWLPRANARFVRHLQARPTDLIVKDRLAMSGLPPIQPLFGFTNRVRLPRDYYVSVLGNDYSVDPVGIADLAADNATLLLWVTNSALPAGLEVMKAWGFEYKTNAVWDKYYIGLGNYFRNNHEVLLHGVRGKAPFKFRGQRSTFMFPRQEHSRKPAEMIVLIERVLPGGRYLELFARERPNIHVEQQAQRVDGQMTGGPVKTENSRRTLPLLPETRRAILKQLDAVQSQTGASLDELIAAETPLLTMSQDGGYLDPKTFSNQFLKLSASLGLPRVTIHVLRHTAATNLKNVGVPARDVQLILGHAHVTTTQQLYQHADMKGQAAALSLVESQLLIAPAGVSGSQNWQSNEKLAEIFDEFDRNNLGGTSGARTRDTLLKRQVL